MKNKLILPSLATKYFNSLRNENDEAIYTSNDEYMRYFVRQSIKIGRCTSLNQQCKSYISDNVFKIISQESNVKGNLCEIKDNIFDYTNSFKKSNETKVDSQLKTINAMI